MYFSLLFSICRRLRRQIARLSTPLKIGLYQVYNHSFIDKIGSTQSEFPVMMLQEYSVSTTSNLLCKCEEILCSRKCEQFGRTYDYDCNYVISTPEGVPTFYWWLCLLTQLLSLFVSLQRYDPRLSTASKLDSKGWLRLSMSHYEHIERFRIFVLLSSAKHSGKYRNRNNQQCCALDYYYHNINYSMMRMGFIQVAVEEQE